MPGKLRILIQSFLQRKGEKQIPFKIFEKLLSLENFPSASVRTTSERVKFLKAAIAMRKKPLQMKFYELFLLRQKSID